MKLKSVLFVATSFVAVLALVAAGTLITLARSGRESAAYLVIALRSVQLAQQLRLDAGAYGQRRQLELEPAIDRELDEATQLIQSNEEAAIVATLKLRMAALRGALAKGAPQPEVLAATREADRAARDLLNINLQQAYRADEAVARRMSTGAQLALIVAALLLVGTAAVLFWLRARLLAPLSLLRERIRAAALGQRADAVERRMPLELRELSETFEVLLRAVEVRRRERLELLRNVASQIAVPLDQVASATAALGGERTFARPAQPMLAELGRESARLHRKLVDLIDAGRIEEGDLELRLETVDLRELASEAVELFRPLAPGYSFALVLAEEALHVDADPLRLQQALHALLSASLRRPPAAGEVSVRAAADGERCALSIDVRFHEPVPFEQLFSALHGLDRSVVLVPGSGLGVRSSRRIVEALGGQLHVEARDERRIQVRLSLPARRRLTLARS